MSHVVRASSNTASYVSNTLGDGVHTGDGEMHHLDVLVDPLLASG